VAGDKQGVEQLLGWGPGKREVLHGVQVHEPVARDENLHGQEPATASRGHGRPSDEAVLDGVDEERVGRAAGMLGPSAEIPAAPAAVKSTR